MKTSVADPWSNGSQVPSDSESNGNDVAQFEDSFVSERLESSRLSDSEQYLARLYSKLKNVKGGTSKKDLINSLSDVKADCIARLVTNGQCFESEEEAMLAANPVIRHIAPHLQALTASELVHLLKADVLQTVVDELNAQDQTKIETEQLLIKEQSQMDEAENMPLETEQTFTDKLQAVPTQIEQQETESLQSERSETENARSDRDANICDIESESMERKDNMNTINSLGI